MPLFGGDATTLLSFLFFAGFKKPDLLGEILCCTSHLSRPASGLASCVKTTDCLLHKVFDQYLLICLNLPGFKFCPSPSVKRSY